MYLHGGGFVIGDVESYDPLCRAITNACNCVVVSVDYRLAPEYKFPSAVIDSFDATNWVYKQFRINLMESGSCYCGEIVLEEIGSGCSSSFKG
nr:alpha/beta hydrolase fold domain-containing protein [Saccharolobus solfataricus]